MIVTFTANPSLDQTATIPGELVRGGVNRLASTTTEPGGKGVNVARVLHMSGCKTLTVLPADADDPILTALQERGVTSMNVATGSPVRSNLTLTEPDGTTTKLNAPGTRLTPEVIRAAEAVLVDAAQGADWVVLAGSLPPGAPDDWYPRLIQLLRPTGTRIAVDTSDEPLMALANELDRAAPDLIKPNSEELGQLCGLDGSAVETAAERGDLGPALEAASRLLAHGIEHVLVTLGGAGALLVTPDGAWRATPPPITLRSTVGAGDSSLAGYLLALLDGSAPAERLARAVSYGSAAAALPGSGLPEPHDANLGPVPVTSLKPPPLSHTDVRGDLRK